MAVHDQLDPVIFSRIRKERTSGAQFQLLSTIVLRDFGNGHNDNNNNNNNDEFVGFEDEKTGRTKKMTTEDINPSWFCLITLRLISSTEKHQVKLVHKGYECMDRRVLGIRRTSIRQIMVPRQSGRPWMRLGVLTDVDELTRVYGLIREIASSWCNLDKDDTPHDVCTSRIGTAYKCIRLCPIALPRSSSLNKRCLTHHFAWVTSKLKFCIFQAFSIFFFVDIRSYCNRFAEAEWWLLLTFLTKPKCTGFPIWNWKIPPSFRCPPINSLSLVRSLQREFAPRIQWKLQQHGMEGGGSLNLLWNVTSPTRKLFSGAIWYTFATLITLE